MGDSEWYFIISNFAFVQHFVVKFKFMKEFLLFLCNLLHFAHILRVLGRDDDGVSSYTGL